MNDGRCSWTRRGLLAAMAAGVAAVCGCGIQRGGLDGELPYHGIEEVPHEVMTINPATMKVPTGPKSAVTEDLGPVFPRKEWTTVEPKAATMRPMGGVNLVTIHHSGDGKAFLAKDAIDVAKHLEAVRQWHLTRGMVDIGYHFAIDGAGRVWQLRHLKYEGQHVRIGANGKRWNEHNIGIVLVGDFTKQELSAAQGKRLVEFVKFLRTRYALPASAVKMHGELVKTDCPGGSLEAFVKQQRAAKGL